MINPFLEWSCKPLGSISSPRPRPCGNPAEVFPPSETPNTRLPPLPPWPDTFGELADVGRKRPLLSTDIVTSPPGNKLLTGSEGRSRNKQNEITPHGMLTGVLVERLLICFTLEAKHLQPKLSPLEPNSSSRSIRSTAWQDIVMSPLRAPNL